MKRWLDTADEYITTWKIRDVALLKLCVCAAGFLLGMVIPRGHGNKGAIAASVVFSVTYVMIMLPFLKRLERNGKAEEV